MHPSSRFVRLRVLAGVVTIAALGLMWTSCKSCNWVGPRTDSNNPIMGGQTHFPSQQVPLYFVKSAGSKIELEGVTREIVSKESALKVALDGLLVGPNEDEKSEGFFSEIPKGTKLLGIDRKGNAIRVNLSSEFTEGGGSNSMQTRVDQIAKTIRAVEKEHPVYLDVNGKELQVLGGEGVVVHEPINRGGDAT